MDDYKELSIILYYNDFALWRKEFPYDLSIPDNQLTFIILNSLVKNMINGENLVDGILNSLQFTDVPDTVWYQTERKLLIDWLIQGSSIYKNQIESVIARFSQINHIFTNSVKEKNYILLNIYGKSIKNGEKFIGRIPSTDGIPETVYRNNVARYSKFLHDRGHR